MKKVIYNYLQVLLGVLLSVSTLYAQENKWDFELSGGVKVGGATPLGLPKEIREIQSYKVSVPVFIKVNVNYNINEKWGVRSGLVLEGKGMNTAAKVEGYKTSFNANEDPSQNVRGYYYGDITTKVDNIYATVPLQATLQLGNRWNMQLGPYFSYALSRRFYGKAVSGYIRNETPTGEKVGVSDFAYDFRKSIRKYDVGASLGTKYSFGAAYHVLAQVDYGVNSIMKTGFESVSFGLHNVYFNLGVGVKL